MLASDPAPALPADVSGTPCPVVDPPHGGREATPERRSWLAPAGLGAAALAATTYVAVLDPNTSHAFPICPLRYYTGIDCPACGGLRAAFSLTRGDVLQAADHNLLFVLALPVLILVYGLWLARSLGHRFPRSALKAPPHTAIALSAVVIVFTVARNLDLPGLAFLASR